MKYNPNPPIYVDEAYPELIQFFENKEDAHVGKSHPYKKNMICPCCKRIYPMLVSTLIKSGRVSCLLVMMEFHTQNDLWQIFYEV